MTDDELEAFCKQLPSIAHRPRELQLEFWANVFDTRSFWAGMVARALAEPEPDSFLKYMLIDDFKETMEEYETFPHFGCLYNHVPAPLPPPESRFEGMWMCSPPGNGKTTLIENFIAHDMKMVEQGKASVVVMDSQGRNELLGRLSNIPHTLIDTDTPLNIFSLGNNTGKTEREREIQHNNALDLIQYVFSSTLGEGGKFTQKQSVLFTYCVQLLLVSPGSTLVDFRDLLLPKALEKYPRAIERLDAPAQTFFKTQFDDPKQYGDTKKELHWRLDKILQRKAFTRMFTQPKSVDLFTELSKPQLILVDTDKALLGNEGTEIFGRFIIAMLLSTSQRRATLPSHQRLPTYVFIDECQDYIATDPSIATLFDQCRKMKIALTLAHQRQQQIKNSDVLDALRHTSIQFHDAGKYVFRMTGKGIKERNVRCSPVKFPEPEKPKPIPKAKRLTYEEVRKLPPPEDDDVSAR